MSVTFEVHINTWIHIRSASSGVFYWISRLIHMTRLRLNLLSFYYLFLKNVWLNGSDFNIKLKKTIMTNKLIEITSLPSEERYDYFLSQVADERELWVLVNANDEFLKLHSDELNVEALLVWPSTDLALQYAQETGESLAPKSIALPQFFMKWVAGLEGDGLLVNVFPNQTDDAWLIEPKELKAELQDVINSAF